MGLLILFVSSNRRVWIFIVQEMFLTYYFYVFSVTHDQDTNELKMNYFMLIYFTGLSVSTFGLLFEIVDNKKKDCIPKEAW